MPFVSKRFEVLEPMPLFLFLMRTFSLSQAEAQSWIGKGRVSQEGVPIVETGKKVAGTLEIRIFDAQSKGRTPLFENDDFMLFEKPAGLLVHPNKMSAGYSMLDEIRHYGGKRANAVHRLDMETSGLLLAAKHKEAERALKALFEQRKVVKMYLAWVAGKIEKPFEVDAPIAKIHDYSDTKHKVKIDKAGFHAHTRFVPLRYDKARDATLLRCLPLTGRTHQIRIHLFHVKHPILGDPIYNADFVTANRYLNGLLNDDERIEKTGAKRLMLHAYSLAFEYRGKRYSFESQVALALDD